MFTLELLILKLIRHIPVKSSSSAVHSYVIKFMDNFSKKLIVQVKNVVACPSNYSKIVYIEPNTN